MSLNVIAAEAAIAKKASLGDEEIERIVRRGDAEFFRQVAKEVIAHKTTLNKAAGLIERRAHPTMIHDALLIAVFVTLKLTRIL